MSLPISWKHCLFLHLLLHLNFSDDGLRKQKKHTKKQALSRLTSNKKCKSFFPTLLGLFLLIYSVEGKIWFYIFRHVFVQGCGYNIYLYEGFRQGYNPSGNNHIMHYAHHGVKTNPV